MRHDDHRIGPSDAPPGSFRSDGSALSSTHGHAVTVLRAPARGVDTAALRAEIVERERSFSGAPLADRSSFDDLVRRARTTGDGLLIARCHCLLGRFLTGNGRHDAALESAHHGLGELEAADPAVGPDYLPTRAELLRLGGDALLKLGRVAEAFPLLEEAVAVAQHATAVIGPASASGHRAAAALVRSLHNLGGGLFDVREIESSIDVLRRALGVVDTDLGSDDLLVDDLLLATANLVRALHERVRRDREAGQGENAECDLREARGLLDALARSIDDFALDGRAGISAYGRHAYLHSFGDHLLLTGDPAAALQMFVRQIDEAAREPIGSMHDLIVALARTGMAQAMLALDAPQEALAQCALALERFACCEDAGERAAVLFVKANALRRLGRFEAAYTELEAYHALCGQLQASAVQRYARYVNAKLGLERALAEIDSHRRVAVTLATLGRIGQEITAHLDAAAVVNILRRHVGTLLDVRASAVWLVDDSAHVLVPAVDNDRDGAGATIALDHPTSPAARCVRERAELVVMDRSFANGTRPPRSVMFAPFCLGERVLGVLSIESNRTDAYGENERSIMRTLCTYGAIALDNASAYREVGRVVSELRATQSELALRTAEYERLSMTDALTGLPNRRHFITRAAVEVAEARRSDGLLAVGMFDIDHFKRINDTFGHFVGDLVLGRIAAIAKDALRPADLIARIGGEEFALLLPGAGAVEAAGIAERIRASFERTADYVDGLALEVTASFGVATLALPADTFDDAFARADRALYRSKQLGRNCVCVEK